MLQIKRNYFKTFIDENMQTVESNYFWYINSSNNVCTYIHKIGKKKDIQWLFAYCNVSIPGFLLQ